MTRYPYRNRPPSIGCQPDGFIPDTREAWLPAREIEGRYFLGCVEYLNPLSFDDIHRYELWPTDKVEWAEYIFWLESSDWLRADYLSQDDETLEKYASRDIKAQAALILKQAGRE